MPYGLVTGIEPTGVALTTAAPTGVRLRRFVGGGGVGGGISQGQVM